ncbi:MAG: glutamate-5-semialdehyde dehydrogenase [Clostridia bacterium]|nr:glutamate-5-semialdehyde dehydrogenase [Clostridia bacterium]
MAVRDIAQKSKEASRALAAASYIQKKDALTKMAQSLIENQGKIIEANRKDMENAEANGVSGALLDRLRLTPERIADMSDAILKVRELPDPVGEFISMTERPNGLKIGQKRVPMGVVAIIYEARPNVTADAAALCIKTGNAVILRGGKEAINSNIAIVDALRDAISGILPGDAIALIKDTSRESARELMELHGLIDVLIPRGGAGLIKSVVENAKVPVIETGVGNCHIYIDEFADLDMALKILINAKTQRPGVCNAAESLLVHKNIASEFLPMAEKALCEKGVKILGCERTRAIIKADEATDDDFAREFLDLIISVKVVDSLDGAISHIAKYSTGHSEAIVTENYTNAQKFLDTVDSAAVYVNASTRFTDGGEFGFGAEIGISTQKLHARGPMGLLALTTTKYVIYGSGQIR